MELHYGTSCEPCIEKFVGPALDRLGESLGVGHCGGCGHRDREIRRFSYWFPWPDEEVR